MRKTSEKIFALLMVPVVVWSAWTAFLAYERETGTVVVLKIKGYDPRDLIAGHYLRFEVDYGKDGLPECGGDGKNRPARKETAYLCLETKQITPEKPENCRVFIKGVCAWGRFRDGLNRYYIPENRAKELDAAVRKGGYGIEVSVRPDGAAFIKDLKVLEQ